jgi:hypothetical protein
VAVGGLVVELEVGATVEVVDEDVDDVVELVVEEVDEVVVVGAIVVEVVEVVVVVVGPTPLDNPVTSVGVVLFVVVLSPSCPRWFFPQHLTAPVESNAQVWNPPAVMTLTPPDKPVTSVGVVRFVVVPSPTLPSPFFPQHFAAPVESNAQVCS